jgi:glyoxylase-like metal-dependent hydrolase (beta-lactamase superfamily II)
MRRLILLGLLVAAGSLSLLAAQPPAQPAGPRVIDIVKLKDNMYVLTTSTPGNPATFSGGNVAVFITDGGVTLVDTKLAGWGQAVLDKVKGVTSKPITRIINTHTHGDHTGNNGLFGANVEIVAHENTKTNMEKMDAFKDENAKYLPGKTYKDKMTLGSGKDRVDLYYFGRGHTNGDTWIIYPSLRVMQTGDMFAWKDAPLLDKSNGGTGVEYAATVRKAVAAATNVDTLIVGHSPLRTVPELKEYAQFMDDLVAAVKEAKAAGKSATDAAASIDLTTKYKGYKKERQTGAVQVIYDELK